jgi:hypothetical protein
VGIDGKVGVLDQEVLFSWQQYLPPMNSLYKV